MIYSGFDRQSGYSSKCAVSEGDTCKGQSPRPAKVSERFIMATAQEPQRSGTNLEEEYPEEVGERLAWFARELGVSEDRILGLLGLTRADVLALPGGGVDWHSVAQDHEDEVWWAEAMLYDALALFRHDTGTLRRHLPQAARDYLIYRPGGSSVAASTLPPEERDRTLLTLLASGGSASLQALIAYLAQPDNRVPSP
jgi:hypothetical protein